MAAIKTAPPPIVVPGVDNITRLGQNTGQPIAIFVKGLDVFLAVNTAEVTLKGTGTDNTVTAQVVGSKPGRLFALSQEFIGQSSAVMVANSQGGYAFQDSSHFNALKDLYGADSIGPLEPYTVLQVRVTSTPITAIPTP